MSWVSSKAIAEKLGKRHDNLLREIRKYTQKLGNEAGEYFRECTVGKRVAYEVSFSGCELLGAKLLGEAGKEYRAWCKEALGEAEEPEEITSQVISEYTVQEVAEMLGVSERSVYRNIQSGKLDSFEKEVMIPTMKKFVTAEALDRFMKERKAG